MHDLNDALDELRAVIPYAHGPSVRKLSKIATLLLAKNYILMQARALDELRRLVGYMNHSAAAAVTGGAAPRPGAFLGPSSAGGQAQHQRPSAEPAGPAATSTAAAFDSFSAAPGSSVAGARMPTGVAGVPGVLQAGSASGLGGITPDQSATSMDTDRDRPGVISRNAGHSDYSTM